MIPYICLYEEIACTGKDALATGGHTIPARRSLIILVVALSMLLVLALPTTASTMENGPQIKTVSVSLTMPTLTIDEAGGHSLAVMEGATQWAVAEGSPLVPTVSRAILLPSYAGEILDMAVITDDATDAGEAILLPSVTSQSVDADIDLVAMRDDCIYSSYEPYPGMLYTSDGSVGLMKGLKILHVTLMPVQYLPATGEVVWFRGMTITITFTIEDPTEAAGLPTIDLLLDGNLDSYEIVTTADDVDMLIITDASMVNEFQRLVAWKASVGVTTQVVTVEQILSSYGGVDDQERIRACIKEWYADHGLDFVLLGGDDEIIPHRGMLGMAAGGTYSDVDVASDLYYAGLDGNWNDDGDALYGELGEEDLYAEVWVGRAPVDSVDEAVTFVDKVIAYESQSSSEDHLDQALFLGEKLDSSTWGGDFKDQVEQYADDLEVTKLYDKIGNMNKTNAFEAINQGVHLVNNMGHGNVNTVAGMYTHEMHLMENDDHFIWYSQSCYSASFDDRYSTKSYAIEDCIAEQMVTDEHGAVAFIGNSRYGFYYTASDNGPSNEFDKQFFKAVCQDGVPYLGQALQMSKEALASTTSTMDATRWVYYELNLLGDPSLRIGGYGDDHAHDLAVDGDEELAATVASMGWAGNGTSASPYEIRGLVLSPSSGTGLSLSNIDSHVLVVDCDIDGTGGTGLDLMGAANVSVDDCQFIGLDTGINVQWCECISIDGSMFLENDVGVRMISSHDVSLTGSVITRSLGRGVSVTDSFSVTITGNALFDNNGADTVYSSTHPQAGGQTSSVDWDGNHWSDLDVDDTNDDGVLDASYVTAGGGTDGSPLAASPFPVPVLEITSPSETGWYGAQVNVAWSASHTSGLMGFMFRDDADAWSPTYQRQATMILEHGQNKVWVKALAADGTMAWAQTTLQADLIVPTVLFTSPADDILVVDEAVTVKWTANDADSGIAQRSISLDDGAWQTVTGGSHTFSSLGPGQHAIVLRVVDMVGNAAEDTLTVTVDSLAPTLSITSPVQGSALSSSSVTMSWTVYDVNGLSDCMIRIDDGPWIDIDVTSYTFHGLVEGEHILFVSATDMVGNEALAQLTVTIDTIAPSLALLSPSQGAMLDASSVTFSWAGSDLGTGVQTYLTSVDDGTWSDMGISQTCTMMISEGWHEFSIRAFDGSGNMAEINVTFMVDLTAPSLLLGLDDGGMVSASHPGLIWSAEDALSGVGAVSIKIDDGEWDPAEPDHDIIANDGPHVLSMMVLDVAGNVLMLSLNYTVDTVAPDLAMDVDGAIYDGDVLIRWHVLDDTLNDVMVELSLDDGCWMQVEGNETLLDGLLPGEHEMVLRAIDVAGNMANVSTSVICWFEPPIVVRSPSILYEHSSIEISLSEHAYLDTVSITFDNASVAGVMVWNGNELTITPTFPFFVGNYAALILSCQYIDGTLAPDWLREYLIEACTKPSAPLNASLEVGPDGTVVSWEPVDYNGGHPVIGYNVYRITSEGETYLGFVDALCMTDDGDEGIRCSYKISAVTEFGEGAPLYTQVVEGADVGVILSGSAMSLFALFGILSVAGIVLMVCLRKR